MSYVSASAALCESARDRLFQSWRSSVDALMQADGEQAWPRSLRAAVIADDPSPLGLAAYFDWQLALSGQLDAVSAEALEATAKDWFREGPCGYGSKRGNHSERPVVKAFDPAFYSPAELERMARWLDTDAGSLIGFRGPDAVAFDKASSMLRSAWSLASCVSAELAGEWSVLASEIVLLEGRSEQGHMFRGAASFALWGAIALNVSAHQTVLDYFVSLVHECSHSLLFAHAMETPLVLNDPEEVYHSPLRDDPRPMDGVFHAAYVSAREALALRALKGRLEEGFRFSDASVSLDAVVMQLQASEQAFHACDSIVRAHAELTPLGLAVIEECRQRV